jgi:hypothetical protein
LPSATRTLALPDFLRGVVGEQAYRRWVRRKAAALRRRDLRRWNEVATPAMYRQEIHAAVLRSSGRDAYTGLELDWRLISQYDNSEAATARAAYRRRFYNLPTVDHVRVRRGAPVFAICSWQVNDAKHDQSIEEFRNLCRAVLVHAQMGA